MTVVPRPSVIPAASLVIAVVGIVLSGAAAAQNRGMKQQQQQSQFGAALPAAGLDVRFHENARCAPISSPYGSPTRYDGSSRRIGGGPGVTHGGIDLTLAEGTPLLAIAPGAVFATGEGGRMEGNYLWLLHLPSQSGLPFAFLTKYQHLAARPPFRRGDAVAVGQEIARSGSTGTVGGHYGAAGYAHLHLTVRAIPADKVDAAVGSEEAFSIPRDSIQIDPLAVYVPGLRSPTEANELPPERKQLVVGYVGASGAVRPASTRVVWPVSCP